MKTTITFNAKCVNCKHFEILTEDEYDFLDKPFCKLDGKFKKDSDSCSKLEIDLKSLKCALSMASITRFKIDKKG